MSETEIKETKEKKAEEADFSLKKEIVSWIYTIALAFFIALFLNHFVIVNANVPTGSMENTIMPGDRLVGNRLAYKFGEPQRGDIIIFRYPVDEKEIYIKRLIGLPGETLKISDGKVYINGSETPLEEDYLKEEWVIRNDGIELEIPEDCYFMMGDNRNNSADGRFWPEEAVRMGKADDLEDAAAKDYYFVKRKKILGKAIFRYYPFTEIGVFHEVEY